MIRGIRAATTLLVLSVASIAQAQHHEAKPAQAHAAPAAEKPATHDTKAAPAAHETKSAPAQGAKPATPAAEKARAKAPAKVAVASAEDAVARVMKALDRELGPAPTAPPARANRPAPQKAKPNASKIAVSWKIQIAWPEADAPGEPLRVEWPAPVLESMALRFSYIGLPK